MRRFGPAGGTCRRARTRRPALRPLRPRVTQYGGDHRRAGCCGSSRQSRASADRPAPGRVRARADRRSGSRTDDRRRRRARRPGDAPAGRCSDDPRHRRRRSAHRRHRLARRQRPGAPGPGRRVADRSPAEGYVVAVGTHRGRHHVVLAGVDTDGTYYAARTFDQLVPGQRPRPRPGRARSATCRDRDQGLADDAVPRLDRGLLRDAVVARRPARSSRLPRGAPDEHLRVRAEGRPVPP